MNAQAQIAMNAEAVFYMAKEVSPVSREIPEGYRWVGCSDGAVDVGDIFAEDFYNDETGLVAEALYTREEEYDEEPYACGHGLVGWAGYSYEARDFLGIRLHHTAGTRYLRLSDLEALVGADRAAVYVNAIH